MNHEMDFDQAIDVARKALARLVKTATGIVLEGAVVSPDGTQYEVIYSYDDNSALGNDVDGSKNDFPSNMRTLATLMGKRRYTKVFMIDRSTGDFMGFKNYRE